MHNKQSRGILRLNWTQRNMRVWEIEIEGR